MLYLLFRTGLPDHEVFANLTLGDIVEPAPLLRGFDREQVARRLSQQRLNLVVCTKQFEVVAVILLAESPPAALTRDEGYVKACLNTAGIRLVRIDPAALPRHQQVRALVYGDVPPGAA